MIFDKVTQRLCWCALASILTFTAFCRECKCKQQKKTKTSCGRQIRTDLKSQRRWSKSNLEESCWNNLGKEVFTRSRWPLTWPVWLSSPKGINSLSSRLKYQFPILMEMVKVGINIRERLLYFPLCLDVWVWHQHYRTQAEDLLSPLGLQLCYGTPFWAC